ncbi:MAG: DUF4010 domain-containing protein [bacterium]|nr:DUF4010 domain-containing protein [bacterium]
MMNASTQLVFEQLGISLVLGLLVGLQRQHSESLIAGVRTFPLITIFGTMAATLDKGSSAEGWIVPAGLLALVAVVVVTYIFRFQRDRSGLGMTTEAAILLMYLVGVYVVFGDRIVAIAIGVGVAVLLQLKPELHGIASKLADNDLRAIMTFALITFIILPIVPDTTYDLAVPLNVLNPFRIWLMVVLMVGISLGGYLVYKFFGRNASVLAGGLLGGLISSTATTISYAKRTRDNPQAVPLAAVVVLLASTVVYARVLIEIFVVTPGNFVELARPVSIMMAASAVSTAMMFWHVRSGPEEMPEQKNPTELKSALVFAGLYAGVMMALSAAQQLIGPEALYGVAVLSGLTDMDAITLSSSRLVEIGPAKGGIEASIGWRLIIVATMANHFFKGAMCLLIGSRKLAVQVALLFALPLATGAGMLWLWA